MLIFTHHVYMYTLSNLYLNIKYQYNFRAEQKVSSNLIDQAVPHTTLHKLLQAVYIKNWPKQLPVAGLQNVSDEEIAELNIRAVPKSTHYYATKYGVKIFKGKTASLNLLVYFGTVQKATVSTAGAEIVNRYITMITLKYK